MLKWCALALATCLACKGGGSAAGAGGSGGGHAGKGGSDASLPVDASSDAGDGGVCFYDPNAPPPDNCPDVLPSGCDGPAPSYKDSVAPTIATYCQPCHRSGGMAPDKPFDTYAHVYTYRRTMLDRVNRCLMPLSCAPQPTTAERQQLLQWLVCAAPQN